MPLLRAFATSLVRLLFPRGIRVWHFIVIPPVAMAVLLGLFHALDHAAAEALPTGGALEAYLTARTVAISLAMASIIAFLAVQYRTGYEKEIRAQNEALARTRDFLSGIIRGTADAIIVRDSAGEIRSWNPAAEEIFGWPAGEMTGRPADPLVARSATGLEGLRRIDAALREGHTVRDIETEATRRDGGTITVSLTAAPLYDASGAFAGSTAIVRDVTALKQMEKQLVAKERLAAVGELAAVVAHEIRNPLAGIRGGCEILLEGYPGGDPRHDIGVEVIHQVDRLNRTVHDLLLFARPKVMDLLPTDLHALLDRILHVLKEDPENAAVDVVRDYEPRPPVVPADARQLEQVFVNLVLNAIQAMNHRGTVTITTRASDHAATVSIRDTGPGIPPEAADQIFNPFFTTRAQGTGLGLAIVKKIVTAHGGTIEAASPKGSGAVFSVTLPREG